MDKFRATIQPRAINRLCKFIGETLQSEWPDCTYDVQWRDGGFDITADMPVDKYAPLKMADRIEGCVNTHILLSNVKVTTKRDRKRREMVSL